MPNTPDQSRSRTSSRFQIRCFINCNNSLQFVVAIRWTKGSVVWDLSPVLIPLRHKLKSDAWRHILGPNPP